jgi:hypothetical protein
MKLNSALFGRVVVAGMLALDAPQSDALEPTFDYGSYQPTTLDELVATVPKIDEGMDIFLKKRQFEIRIEGRPKRCTALIVGRVLRMLGIDEPPEASHCMQVSGTAGKKREVFVQDALVESLREHVKKGDIIRVYALYFYYAAASGNLGILINEFDDPLHHQGAEPNSGIQPSAGAAALASKACALARRG